MFTKSSITDGSTGFWIRLCKLTHLLICRKKTLVAFNQLDEFITWNRIKDEVNKVRLMKNLLQCKNKIRNSKEAYKRAKEKNRQKAHMYFWHILNWGDVGIWRCHGILEVPTSWSSYYKKLNRNGELTTFDEEREDQEIRENMRIISISSCPILSANFHVPTFHHVSVSFPHVWFSRQVPSHFPLERWFFFSNIRCNPVVTERYTTGIPVWNAWKQPLF